MKSDRFMSTFRKMRRDLIEQRGWLIDTDEVEKYRGKKLFAIPSPRARRRWRRGGATAAADTAETGGARPRPGRAGLTQVHAAGREGVSIRPAGPGCVSRPWGGAGCGRRPYSVATMAAAFWAEQFVAQVVGRSRRQNVLRICSSRAAMAARSATGVGVAGVHPGQPAVQPGKGYSPDFLDDRFVSAGGVATAVGVMATRVYRSRLINGLKRSSDCRSRNSAFTSV